MYAMLLNDYGNSMKASTFCQPALTCHETQGQYNFIQFHIPACGVV